jgi:RND family efflux transporter MFP subunit
MKSLFLLLCLAAFCGCQKPAVNPGATAAADSEPHPEVATNWTPRSELFVEYPPLVAGQVSRFAIHFTRMDNFRPVTKGYAEVRLLPAGGAPLVFRAEAPSRPGIFGVDVKPLSAGEVQLSISFSGEGIQDTHQLGAVPVAATKAAALHEHEEEDAGGLVAFLKEQQWTLDFATSVVEDKSVSASLRVPAEVEPRSAGRAEVDSPFDGRLVLDQSPIIGARVQAGQVLARVLLPVSNPGDLPGLELARREAVAFLQLARKDHDRAQRLVNSGAAPAKRLDEAAASLATAEARLQAADARLSQFEASRQAESAESGAKSFAVKSPLTGIVEAVRAAPGSNVKAGDPLFQIVDLDAVFVSAIVPESEIPRLRALSGAELEIPGIEAPRRLTNLVTVGRVVDAPSRTFPVVYQFDNRSRLISINQTVYVRLLFESGPPAPVIPETALVDDGGQPIVFVQRAGETFVRRPIKLGQRAGGFVQALDGVFPGERVVTKGAHLIRLASMSNQVPAHGHVH